MAYLVNSQNSATNQDSLDLMIAIWDSKLNKISKLTRITSFKRSTISPILKIRYHDTVLHIVCAINYSAGVRQGDATVYNDSSFLYALNSNDNGINWSKPRNLLKKNEGAKKINKYDVKHIKDINLLSIDKFPLLIYQAKGEVYLKNLSNKEDILIDLINYNPGPLSAAFNIKSLSFASLNESGVIAWIDTRFTKTDRRWWKPLGGWPWSDQPDWSNNDIFLLNTKELRQMIAKKENQRVNKDNLLRVTPPLSIADIIKINPFKKGYLLMWTGRRKIDEDKKSINNSNEIFMIKIKSAWD